MPRVLVVEDTRLFANTLRSRIEIGLGCEVVHASTMAEAKAHLDAGETFDAATVDLTLPDSTNGEIVDLVAPHAPTIVLTGDLDDSTRDAAWRRRIADYVLKDGPYNLEYAVRQLERLLTNRSIKILVVDDAKLARTLMRGLLRAHNFTVLEAGDGEAALLRVTEHPDVRIVIADYNMPNMDGFRLVEALRKTHSKDELAIIGVSATDNPFASARFLKLGANDFLRKPFISEEFYCRLNNSLELQDYIRKLRESSYRDELTGLHNRKFFFETASSPFCRQCRDSGRMVVAMVDIDRFKAINETFGQSAGDDVLRYVARILRFSFPEGSIVARFGGAEFCVLVPDLQISDLHAYFDKVRKAIAGAPARVGDRTIHFTASVGVCTEQFENVEDMVRIANAAMYEAKRAGRNRVEVAPDENAGPGAESGPREIDFETAADAKSVE